MCKKAISTHSHNLSLGIFLVNHDWDLTLDFRYFPQLDLYFSADEILHLCGECETSCNFCVKFTQPLFRIIPRLGGVL